MQAAHGWFVLIQSTAEPHIRASTSAARRIVAFGENQIADISLYNGKLKVEDVFSRAAEAPQRPADWCQPLAVYYLDEVIGGAKHYCLMRAVDGFYHTEFSMGRVHELYLHFPPPEIVSLSDHRKLMEYIKWKSPGEDDRILVLPDEALNDPNVSGPGYEDMKRTVQLVSLNYKKGQRTVSQVVMPILEHAARAVNFPLAAHSIGDQQMLDVQSTVAVGRVPVKVIAGGIEKRILLKGRLDTAVYHKSRLIERSLTSGDLDSVLLVVAIKAGSTASYLSPNDEYVRHTIAQAYAVLEQRRIIQGAAGSSPSGPSQRMHFVVVNGQAFRFGCLELTGGGALLPHLSNTVSLNVDDITGEPKNLSNVLRCLIWILETAVSASLKASDDSAGEVDNDPPGGGETGGGRLRGERRRRDSVGEDEEEEARRSGGGVRGRRRGVSEGRWGDEKRQDWSHQLQGRSRGGSGKIMV